MLRYGLVGGGFISAFQLRALAQGRGVEVAGLVSRRPPEALARLAREHALRDARVVANLSGRGDKDVSEVLRVRGGR